MAPMATARLSRTQERLACAVGACGKHTSSAGCPAHAVGTDIATCPLPAPSRTSLTAAHLPCNPYALCNAMHVYHLGHPVHRRVPEHCRAARSRVHVLLSAYHAQQGREVHDASRDNMRNRRILSRVTRHSMSTSYLYFPDPEAASFGVAWCWAVAQPTTIQNFELRYRALLKHTASWYNGYGQRA